MSDRLPENRAAEILMTAVREGRAAELIECMYDGGAATVDPEGRLCLASLDDIQKMMGR